MCKKIGFFKKFLSVVLASVTLCSGSLVCNKTYADSPSTGGASAEGTIMALRIATAGVGALTVIIGGVATIIACVHTQDLSSDILKLETEIIGLISDISDLEKDLGKDSEGDSKKNLSPAEHKKLEDRLSKLKKQLVAKNLKLVALHKEYRDSCQDLYWLERNSRYAYIRTYFINHPYIIHYTV